MIWGESNLLSLFYTCATPPPPFGPHAPKGRPRLLHESPARASRAGRVALTNSKELFCALTAPRLWGTAYLCEIMLTRRTRLCSVLWNVKHAVLTINIKYNDGVRWVFKRSSSVVYLSVCGMVWMTKQHKTDMLYKKKVPKSRLSWYKLVFWNYSRPTCISVG